MPAARHPRFILACTLLATICVMCGCSERYVTWIFGSIEEPERTEQWDSRYRTPPSPAYENR